MAPFQRSDGRQYLEARHRRRLADGGDDSIESAMALCPNCHRERHYGINYANGATK
ncbi:HNH endonuclease [Burkholderia ubonensis]|uniref:HNH endonuclease n=1 Tax=Burkholderia ubonensis TaxID=101571 RepID=UPI0009B57CB8